MIYERTADLCPRQHVRGSFRLQFSVPQPSFSLFTFRNILFHQAVQCAFHLYHNVHQPVVLFAKPLVFFFQSIFAMSLHAHCFRPPYASSAAALSCVHFLLLKNIIHFPAIEKWFLNASFDTIRKTPDTHRQASALPPLLPQSGRLWAIPRLLQKSGSPTSRQDYR